MTHSVPKSKRGCNGTTRMAQLPLHRSGEAAEAAASVTDYGHRLFAQVFRDNPDVLAEYRTLQRYASGPSDFEIRGTPAFHALHWEALKDPVNGRPFAAECPFVRQTTTRPPSTSAHSLRPRSTCCWSRHGPVGGKTWVIALSHGRW